MTSLPLKVFTILRSTFFNDIGKPIPFSLRPKNNTQDDPFDEFITDTLKRELRPLGASCQKASGPLISPDLAVYKTGVNIDHEKVNNNPTEIIGIEVKKLERGANGQIARSTGLDYNSTPPCGQVRIYSNNEKELHIKAYYLFACLENTSDGEYFVSAMSLCDGSILNDDFNFYLEITGSREKGINLGTYGDGANRNRPMLIFANPLGAKFLDHKISLISGLDLSDENGNIMLAWELYRSDVNGNPHKFYAYFDRRDLPNEHSVTQICEPFPMPHKRVAETQGRGKFKLLIE